MSIEIALAWTGEDPQLRNRFVLPRWRVQGLAGRGSALAVRLVKVRVDVASQRDPWLAHYKLDMIFKSGALKDCAVVMDLKDDQRGLVWIEGRFTHMLAPGLCAYTAPHQAEIRGRRTESRPVRRVNGNGDCG